MLEMVKYWIVFAQTNKKLPLSFNSFCAFKSVYSEAFKLVSGRPWKSQVQEMLAKIVNFGPKCPIIRSYKYLVWGKCVMNHDSWCSKVPLTRPPAPTNLDFEGCTIYKLGRLKLQIDKVNFLMVYCTIKHKQSASFSCSSWQCFLVTKYHKILTFSLCNKYKHQRTPAFNITFFKLNFLTTQLWHRIWQRTRQMLQNFNRRN